MPSSPRRTSSKPAEAKQPARPKKTQGATKKKAAAGATNATPTTARQRAPRRAKSAAAAGAKRYQESPWVLPRQALSHLRTSHPGLARVIERVGPCTLTIGHAEGPFVALVRAIVFQQLATKAATTIFGCLRDLFPAESFPDPAEILATPDEALRGCGLSGQKLSYLRDLSQRVHRGELDLDSLSSLPDAEVITRLTAVRGIGRWSAQMFLIFYLGRLDVWPDGDLGIRHGVRVLHGHTDLPPAQLMQELGARFSPFASIASWYLWRLLDLPEEERLLLLA